MFGKFNTKSYIQYVIGFALVGIGLYYKDLKNL